MLIILVICLDICLSEIKKLKWFEWHKEVQGSKCVRSWTAGGKAAGQAEEIITLSRLMARHTVSNTTSKQTLSERVSLKENHVTNRPDVHCQMYSEEGILCLIYGFGQFLVQCHMLLVCCLCSMSVCLGLARGISDFNRVVCNGYQHHKPPLILP